MLPVVDPKLTRVWGSSQVAECPKRNLLRQHCRNRPKAVNEFQRMSKEAVCAFCTKLLTCAVRLPICVGRTSMPWEPLEKRIQAPYHAAGIHWRSEVTGGFFDG